MQHRQRLVDNIAAHKQSIIDAGIQKRNTQQEFGRYWRMQMDWTEKTKEQVRNEPYNPDEVWTIEGPTRRAQEKVRRNNAMQDLKVSLDTQKVHFNTTAKTHREGELFEGQVICDND